MSPGDTAWVLMSAALVLFMTVGLAFFYGGLEPKRNVLDMLAMNFFTIALVTIVWCEIGFSLAFGPDVGAGLIGNLHFFGLRNMSGLWPGTHIPKLDFMVFQLMFGIITPALVTGAIAGRLKFEAWIAFCLSWSLVVYPILAHWIFDPQGWIYKLGGRDFAGGAVVHASAGSAALVLVLLLGPRSKQSAASYSNGSVPNVLLGAGILWFGWFGFNGGSALGAGQLASNAFVVSQIAAAAACIVWVLLERRQTAHMTVVGMATGAVVGLVVITPASGFVGPMAAIAIGAIGSLICFTASRLALHHRRFDDAFGVVAVHGIGGVLGMLLLGIFADYAINPHGLTTGTGSHLNGLISGNLSLLGHQVIALVATIGFTVAVTYVIVLIVRSTIGLRVPENEENLSGLSAAFETVERAD